MNKETIIKRLIDEGHCRVWNAASILNLVDDYVNLVDALHVDGNINTEEAICLLNKNPTRFDESLTLSPQAWPPPILGGDGSHTPPDISCDTDPHVPGLPTPAYPEQPKG
jgi:hypothetical protein